MNSQVSNEQIALTERHAAHNYAPLPVVIAEADGAWLTDVEGNRYLDCLAAYSAVNFGHRHPVILDAARRQLERVTLISRAFYSDQLGTFCAELAALCGKEMVLPMNTGAEAVESGIKVARKWAHDVKGSTNPNIIVAAGNFHGRTTTIISFSDDPDAAGRLRSLHPRLPHRAVRRRRRRSGRHRRRHRRGVGGADPGRGRGTRAAGGLPARPARDCARSATCC